MKKKCFLFGLSFCELIKNFKKKYKVKTTSTQTKLKWNKKLLNVNVKHKKVVYQRTVFQIKWIN